MVSGRVDSSSMNCLEWKARSPEIVFGKNIHQRSGDFWDGMVAKECRGICGVVGGCRGVGVGWMGYVWWW